jgi:hypothetical protein
VIELQRASVEEVHLKDKPFCIKLIVDDGRGSALFLALNNDEEYSRWLKRLRKVFIDLFLFHFSMICYFI